MGLVLFSTVGRKLLITPALVCKICCDFHPAPPHLTLSLLCFCVRCCPFQCRKMRGIPGGRTPPAPAQTQTSCSSGRQEPALRAWLPLLERRWEEQNGAKVDSAKVQRSGLQVLVPPRRTGSRFMPPHTLSGRPWLGMPIGKLSLFLRKGRTMERIHLELLTVPMVPYIPRLDHSLILKRLEPQVLCLTHRTQQGHRRTPASSCRRFRRC